MVVVECVERSVGWFGSGNKIYGLSDGGVAWFITFSPVAKTFCWPSGGDDAGFFGDLCRRLGVTFLAT